MDNQQKQKITFCCAVVCGALIENKSWFAKKISGYNFIIAADSGYDHLNSVGITPNVLIGDMDSISNVPTGIECFKYPAKKDLTDFAICLEYCFNNGIDSLDVYGAWGDRVDHSMAAVLTMLQYSKKGLNIRFINDTSELFVVFDKCRLPKNQGYVSVFALDGDAYGVTLKNFEYPLENFTLEHCSPLGVSNCIIGDFGEISVKNGNLLVIVQNQ